LKRTGKEETDTTKKIKADCGVAIDTRKKKERAHGSALFAASLRRLVRLPR
jgi:hypothetical protein